jgi:hypothetical protein
MARAEGSDHWRGGRRGNFAVQLARVFGSQVTGVHGAAKSDLARSIGADDVIDCTCDDFAAAARMAGITAPTAGIQRLGSAGRLLGGIGWCQRVPRGSGSRTGPAG